MKKESCTLAAVVRLNGALGVHVVDRYGRRCDEMYHDTDNRRLFHFLFRGATPLEKGGWEVRPALPNTHASEVTR